MKAVLLAAGEGIRLLPITATRPKHLIQVGGKTDFAVHIGGCEKRGNNRGNYHYALYGRRYPRLL